MRVTPYTHYPSTKNTTQMTNRFLYPTAQRDTFETRRLQFTATRSQPGVTIDVATHADIDAIYKLVASANDAVDLPHAFAPYRTPAMPRDERIAAYHKTLDTFLGDPKKGIMLVAKESNRIVGYACAYFNSQEHLISEHGIYVVPDSQNKHIGMVLLKSLCEWGLQHYHEYTRFRFRFLSYNDQSYKFLVRGIYRRIYPDYSRPVLNRELLNTLDDVIAEPCWIHMEAYLGDIYRKTQEILEQGKAAHAIASDAPD